MDDKMRSHSRYPLNARQQDMARIVAPVLSEKVRRGEYDIDATGMMTMIDGMTMDDVREVVAWYEDGLLDTKFKIINIPQ